MIYRKRTYFFFIISCFLTFLKAQVGIDTIPKQSSIDTVYTSTRVVEKTTKIYVKSGTTLNIAKGTSINAKITYLPEEKTNPPAIAKKELKKTIQPTKLNNQKPKVVYVNNTKVSQNQPIYATNYTHKNVTVLVHQTELSKSKLNNTIRLIKKSEYYGDNSITILGSLFKIKSNDFYHWYSVRPPPFVFI